MLTIKGNGSKSSPSSPDRRAEAVVLVGSSAGDVVSLKRFIASAEASSPMSFVVAQDVAPDLAADLEPAPPSQLAKVLSEATSLRVAIASGGERLVPGRLLVIPPEFDAELGGDRLTLRPQGLSQGANPSMDRLFTSAARLAEESDLQVFGVALSGLGSNGADGMARLKRAGCRAFVQDPSTVDYGGIPRASLGPSDPWLLSPERIYSVICALVEGRKPESMQEGRAASQLLAEIRSLLLEATGVDLTMHKEGALLRRVRQRMGSLGLETLEEYVACLRSRPSERRSLLEAALVTVTQFYRDPEAFKLVEGLLREMAQQTDGRMPLRLWVAGSAGGEEAYTIAFLLHKFFHDLGRESAFELFATDVLEKKIAEGRRGIYKLSQLDNLPADLRQIYFMERQDFAAVVRSVRERVVFSLHDLSRDVPFSSVDFLSCRNVLIYLSEDAKERAFHSMTYALRPGGILFLGASESLGQYEKYFESVSATHRIFRRKKTLEPSSLSVPSRSTPVLLQSSAVQQTHRTRSIEAQLNHVLIHESPVAYLLVDGENQLVYTVGDTSNCLELRDGHFSRDLFCLLNEEFRSAVRSLCSQARNRKSESAVCDLTVRSSLGLNHIAAIPFDPCRPQWLLLSVRRSAEQPFLDRLSLPEGDESMLILEQELSSTRESLHSIIEQYEAAHEELQAANEELQATNEELNAANEELQYSNDELLTVNSEVQVRTRDFQSLAADLESIQSSVEFPLLVVDKELRVRRWVNALSPLVEDGQIHLRDHLTEIEWRSPLPRLQEWVQDVLDRQESRESFVEINDRHFQLKIAPYQRSKDIEGGAVLCFSDLTALHQTKEELAYEKERAVATLGSIGDGVMRIDARGRVDYMNVVAETLTGWPLDSARGRRLRDVLVLLPVDAERPAEELESENLCLQVETGGNLANETSLTLKKRYGMQLMVEAKSSRLVHAGEDVGAVLAIQDVSEKYEAMKLLRWQSRHDSLTGVVNRAAIEERLHSAMVRSKNGQTESAFLFVDLDKFKVVNDACGHLAGDELLRHITDEVADQLRSRDTLARIGGDEFGILLENCSLANAVQVAEKVRKAIDGYRFVWESKIFRVGASIGVASVHSEVVSVSGLIRDADAACYMAKHKGGNTVCVHTRDDHELSKQRQEVSIVADINYCLEEEEGFRLYFQPIVANSSGKVASWEVLIRMFGPFNQFAKPASFLPAAERFGLIRRIDEWVVRHTFQTLATYWKTDPLLPKVSINLSAETVTASSSSGLLKELFEDAEYLRDRIGFEITETAALSNLASANRFIEEVRDYGCRVALDDFGTGVSTYSYLKSLDVDCIKIDGEFIARINQEPVNLEIARSINDIAHMMGMETVAEYVHDQETLDTVRGLGIDYLQGFALGHPYSLEEFISAVAHGELPSGPLAPAAAS